MNQQQMKSELKLNQSTAGEDSRRGALACEGSEESGSARVEPPQEGSIISTTTTTSPSPKS
jgi:hypothetical protein